MWVDLFKLMSKLASHFQPRLCDLLVKTSKHLIKYSRYQILTRLEEIQTVIASVAQKFPRPSPSCCRIPYIYRCGSHLHETCFSLWCEQPTSHLSFYHTSSPRTGQLGYLYAYFSKQQVLSIKAKESLEHRRQNNSLRAELSQGHGCV